MARRTQSNETAVSDEEIITALLNNGTINAAAAAVNLSARAVYDRMHDGEFQALYKSAKADLMRTAVLNLNKQLQAAIDTVVAVMQNEENNAQTRLQAAQTILNNAGKFADRLQGNENAVNVQMESNKSDWFI